MPRLRHYQPKPDAFVNGDNLEDVVISNKGLKELRIDSKTTILVKPENCNEKYAEEFRKKINRRIIV